MANWIILCLGFGLGCNRLHNEVDSTKTGKFRFGTVLCSQYQFPENISLIVTSRQAIRKGSQLSTLSSVRSRLVGLAYKSQFGHK